MARAVEDYIEAAGHDLISKIHRKARRLYGKHNVHINSTFIGGGVAELLNAMIPLLNDAGVDTGWRTIHATPDFYEITKKMHNGMQGDAVDFTAEEKELYLSVNRDFSIYSHLDHDFVFIHDPQPLPLVRYNRKEQPWVWRCHIDIQHPNPEVWNFLKDYLLRYDMVIFSSEKYRKPDLPVEQRVIHPAIDPLSHKNCPLTESEIADHLHDVGIPTDRPFIAQVSRMDPWKDPLGVLDVYRKVRAKTDCRLVFCYNLASDDPEGVRIYDQVYERAREEFAEDDVLFVVGNNALFVNALQRAATVILQKSRREGFCLTVTEALWKGTPVVATTAGGIPEQITDGENGFLVDPDDIDGCADRIVELLAGKSLATSIGEAARETVRRRFLTTRLIGDYMDLMYELSG